MASDDVERFRLSKGMTCSHSLGNDSCVLGNCPHSVENEEKFFL